MTSRRFWRRNGATGWALSAPATLAVIGFLLVPIGAVIAGTFMDPRGVFAPYGRWKGLAGEFLRAAGARGWL